MHAHQCGLIVVGRIPGYGCGHIWWHEDSTSVDIRKHYCPKCGAGPFTFKKYELKITQDEASDPRAGDLGPIARNE